MAYFKILRALLAVKNIPFDVGQYSSVHNPQYLGCVIHIPFSSSFVGQTYLPVEFKFESKFASVQFSKKVLTPSTRGKETKKFIA